MIKRGCILATVVLVGLFAGYFWLLHDRIELFPAVLLSGFGAIGLVMLVSQLKAVVFGSGDTAALKRAEQGLPLEDGREEAVWGPIEALGATLEAPFSGRACVAYEYDAKRPTGDGDETGPAGSTLVGFALAPSVIRSNRGDVNLLGFSLLDKFPAQTFDDAGARARAARYAGSTEFSEMGLAKLGKMLSAMESAMADDDGSVRQDMRRAGAWEAELAVSTLEEKVIAPGETITAIGLWDAAKGGLVPKVRGKSCIVRLLPGGGAAMVIHSSKRPWGPLAFAVVWSGFVHVFIYLVLRLAPK